MENSEKSKPEFRVIIAGTRDFSDYQLLRDKCDAILSSKRQDSNIIIVSGKGVIILLLLPNSLIPKKQ